MSQYLTPFTVVPADDYLPVISLPLEVGPRAIKLRVMGKFLNGVQQMYSKLLCQDGLVIEDVQVVGDITGTSASEPNFNATDVGSDMNPAPNNIGDEFNGTRTITGNVTSPGTLVYGATCGQGDATTVEIQAALYEV